MSADNHQPVDKSSVLECENSNQEAADVAGSARAWGKILAFLRGRGLSDRASLILLYLAGPAGGDPVTPTALAQAMNCTTGGLYFQYRAMAEQGFITRRTVAPHVTHLQLATRGMSLVAAAQSLLPPGVRLSEIWTPPRTQKSRRKSSYVRESYCSVFQGPDPALYGGKRYEDAVISRAADHAERSGPVPSRQPLTGGGSAALMIESGGTG